MSGGRPFTQRWDEDEEQHWRRDYPCPYGKPGDRLWVKESYRVGRGYDGLKPSLLPKNRSLMKIHYEADGPAPDWAGKLRPSIFMCDWMPRITLEITEIRVQRLQEISAADAVAEGCCSVALERDMAHLKRTAYRNHGTTSESGESSIGSVGTYAALWESINGAGSWEANPHVWAISFKRITP